MAIYDETSALKRCGVQDGVLLRLTTEGREKARHSCAADGANLQSHVGLSKNSAG